MPDRPDDADDQQQSTAGGDTGPDNGTDQPADDKPGTGDAGTDGKGAGDDGDGTDWKARSRTWEDRAKANRTAAEQAAADRDKANATLAAVRKAFGLDQDDDEDPKTVAEKAQQAAAEKDAELRTLRIERAAEKAARKAGADVDALLDSRSFAQKVAKLDPADDAFDDDLSALVKKALDDNPRLKAESRPAGPSSADMTGGGEQGASQKNPDDIDELRSRRRKRRSG